jgi:hypothetical protein
MIPWAWLYHYERTRADAQKARARAAVPDVITLDASKAVAALDKLTEALKRAGTTGKDS